LLLEALRDEEPLVQAVAAGQLRERGIPGAMSMLVELLDGPHAPVREAVRASLTEFRFSRFLENFDLLDEQARRETGGLVKRVDAESLARLVEEMKAGARSRRLRAVEMAVAMDAVAEVEEALIERLADVDQFVRAEALRALADRDSPRVRRALRELLLDPRAVVQETAERALQKLAAGSSAAGEDNPHRDGAARLDATGRTREASA
jgi:HEAT repeat protein